MNDCRDYITIEIDLEQHPWFMHCAKKIGLRVEVYRGKYKVFYENPNDLFELGKQVARNPNNDFYSKTGFPKS